ncbi:MAG: 2-amino-4-hydroxy-6-hydroxymethyldihydropteridine diphosphokinase [Fidelibacterota bacterium]
MAKVYIGLGSNIGDRLENIKKALSQLTRLAKTELIGISSVYESDPKYKEDQRKFFNAVAEINTELDPILLLLELKNIEEQMGRNFDTGRNGPRLIDLDIEFYDNLVMKTENLEIPHPRIQERLFVLKPMVQLNKNYKCSKTGKTVNALLQECIDKSNVEKVDELNIASLKS